VAQRMVMGQAAPGADQQPEPLIEPIPHLNGRHRRHPRGRQLDGQRTVTGVAEQKPSCASIEERNTSSCAIRAARIAAASASHRRVDP